VRPPQGVALRGWLPLVSSGGRRGTSQSLPTEATQGMLRVTGSATRQLDDEAITRSVRQLTAYLQEASDACARGTRWLVEAYDAKTARAWLFGNQEPAR
jgi:hypothetical protein